MENNTDDDKRPGVSFTRAQIEAWVGFPLTDDQVSDLEETLPNSSLPDCVATVATEALGFATP